MEGRDEGDTQENLDGGHCPTFKAEKRVGIRVEKKCAGERREGGIIELEKFGLGRNGRMVE